MTLFERCGRGGTDWRYRPVFCACCSLQLAGREGAAANLYGSDYRLYPNCARGCLLQPSEILRQYFPQRCGFSLCVCGVSVGFPSHFYIHQCAKSIINLMRLTVTLCMIVDARVLPSGTTLYSTSATDKSPVRTRHNRPTARQELNRSGGSDAI